MSQEPKVKTRTQAERIYSILKQAQGDYVDGMTFLSLSPPITQFHARIFELQKDGYKIEGQFVDGKTWKEYKLVSEGQASMFPRP